MLAAAEHNPDRESNLQVPLQREHSELNPILVTGANHAKGKVMSPCSIILNTTLHDPKPGYIAELHEEAYSKEYLNFSPDVLN